MTVRFIDGNPGGTELACMKIVEEGMEVFPCPVEPDKAVKPVSDPDALTLQSVFPTVNRCTKCGSCTTACPMSIPVMDSVMRMQQGSFSEVSEDFTTCIHCGLCRFVCEDKVKPHSMGLWIRRSLGKSQVELKIDIENSDIDKLGQELRSLKSRLNIMGPVNLSAPEEYSELNERINFLKSQSDDLQKAIDDLKETIKDINNESRRRFKDMYELINKNFKNVFTKLFEGGELNYY